MGVGVGVGVWVCGCVGVCLALHQKSCWKVSLFLEMLSAEPQGPGVSRTGFRIKGCGVKTLPASAGGTEQSSILFKGEGKGSPHLPESQGHDSETWKVHGILEQEKAARALEEEGTERASQEGMFLRGNRSKNKLKE